MDLEKNSHCCHVSLQSHLSYDLLTNTISFSIFFPLLLMPLYSPALFQSLQPHPLIPYLCNKGSREGQQTRG